MQLLAEPSFTLKSLKPFNSARARRSGKKTKNRLSDFFVSLHPTKEYIWVCFQLYTLLYIRATSVASIFLNRAKKTMTARRLLEQRGHCAVGLKRAVWNFVCLVIKLWDWKKESKIHNWINLDLLDLFIQMCWLAWFDLFIKQIERESQHDATSRSQIILKVYAFKLVFAFYNCRLSRFN